VGRFNEKSIIKIGVRSSGIDSGDWDYSIPESIYFKKLGENTLKEILETIDLLKKRIIEQQKKLKEVSK